MLSLFFFLCFLTRLLIISISEISLQPNFGERIFAGSTRVAGEGDFTPQFIPPILTAIMLMLFRDLGKLQMVVLLSGTCSVTQGKKKFPDRIDFSFQLDACMWLPLLFYVGLALYCLILLLVRPYHCFMNLVICILLVSPT